jgi:hypothetical protein
MKSFAKNILATGMVAIVCTMAVAQPSGYPDISISALSLTAAGPVKKAPAISNNANSSNHPVTITASDNILKCSITVSNASNKGAFNVKLIVVLPAEVTLGTLPLSARVINERGVSAWPGYIQFELFSMAANQDITLEFTFNKLATANKLSAFVFNSVPDANPVNNYKEITY